MFLELNKFSFASNFGLACRNVKTTPRQHDATSWTPGCVAFRSRCDIPFLNTINVGFSDVSLVQSHGSDFIASSLYSKNVASPTTLPFSRVSVKAALSYLDMSSTETAVPHFKIEAPFRLSTFLFHLADRSSFFHV